jgi:hypothetical protein
LSIVMQVWKPSGDVTRLKGQPLWWTVGPSGELAVLFVRRRHLTRHRYPAGWVGWLVGPPFDAVLAVRDVDGSVRHQQINGITMRPSHIALLPDGRLLLVSGRADKDADGSWLPNAVVYSAESRVERSFCLGDDIDVLVSDPTGGVWTAYGDEGIYGGHPASSAGLAGWDGSGHQVWSPEGRLPKWPLAGCAAATESGFVWLAWYSSSREGDTFLSRITPQTGEVSTWQSPLRSPDGLAVKGDRAVLTRRDHNKRSTEVIRAELVDGSWIVTERQKVQVPGRVVMRCGQGREGTLWLRAGKTWLQVDA